MIHTFSATWLIKFSNQGEVIWKKSLVGLGSRPLALTIRADGMIAMVDTSIRVGLIDGNSGQVKWSKRIPPYFDRTAASAFTRDGGLIVGLARHDGGHLMKFAADGTILWQRSSLAGLSKILPLDNGQFVAATTLGTLFQFDGDGNTIWERRYTETQVTVRPSTYGYYDPGFNSLIRLADGSLVAAGVTTNDTPTTPALQAPESDIWIVKTDAVGNLIWSRRYGRVGGTNFDDASGLAAITTSSGPSYVAAYDSVAAVADGLLIVGNHDQITTQTSPGGPDFGLLLKLNSEGLVGVACDWALPSVAQPITLTVKYPAQVQDSEVISASTGPIEINFAHSAISMTTACGDALPPITQPITANAGLDMFTFDRMPISLVGRQSADPAGGGLIYQWTQLSGPVVSLYGANTAVANFVTPISLTQMSFELTVTDLFGERVGRDTVTVTVDKIVTGHMYLPITLR